MSRDRSTASCLQVSMLSRDMMNRDIGTDPTLYRESSSSLAKEGGKGERGTEKEEKRREKEFKLCLCHQSLTIHTRWFTALDALEGLLCADNG